MPRDVNGLYTLPAGNPVVTNTVVSSTWANTTLSDLSTAMSNSLDRTGTATGMTGQFKALSGTVGAPGISFGAETTMGIYRAGAGDMRFAVGGVDVLRFNSTSILALNGAVGTPSYAYANETNSGLYRAGAGDIRFSIAGVDVLKIAAASLSAPSFIPTGATVPANGMYLSAANTVGFATNSVSRGTIDSVGRWSIPSPSAGNALTVNAFAGSSAGVFNSADGTGVVSITPANGSGGYSINISTDATGGKINITSNSRDLELQNSGVTAFKVLTTLATQAVDQASNFFDLGWRDAPQNLQNSNYTLALSDRGKNVHHTSVTPHTWSIPDNSSIAFPIGTIIILSNSGSGVITIQAPPTDALVWLPGGSLTNRTLTGFGQATLLKIAATTWFLTGANIT